MRESEIEKKLVSHIKKLGGIASSAPGLGFLLGFLAGFTR